MPSNTSLLPYVAQQDSQTFQGKEECLSSASRALKAQITLSARASRSCRFSCLGALGCSIRRCPAPSCSILCLGLPLLCEIGKSRVSSLCLSSPHWSEWILWRGLHSFFLPRPPSMAWNCQPCLTSFLGGNAGRRSFLHLKRGLGGLLCQPQLFSRLWGYGRHSLNNDRASSSTVCGEAAPVFQS